MIITDSHLHLWKLNGQRYKWLDNPRVTAIARTYGVADAQQAITGTPVESVILVQAENSVKDTDDMLAAAEHWPTVRGIVGWLPLEDQAALDEALPRFAAAARLVGCRHLNHDELDPAWLARPAVHAGLRMVADRHLTFDVVAVTERHLRDAANLAAEQPDLTVVVDHLGSPPLDTLSWQPWADALAVVAEQPNTVVKVSGLATLGLKNYQPTLLKTYLEHARRQFGAKRMMYGSDWPVSTLALPYHAMWRVIDGATQDWTAADREQLFTRTAQETYRLS